MHPTFYTLQCGGYHLALPASQVLGVWDNEAIRYLDSLPALQQGANLYPVYSLGEELLPRLGPAQHDTHCLLVTNHSHSGGAFALSGRGVSKISQDTVLHKLPAFIMPPSSPLKAMLKYKTQWLYLTDAASLMYALEMAHVQREFPDCADSLVG